jgi:hypothetical protein
LRAGEGVGPRAQKVPKVVQRKNGGPWEVQGGQEGGNQNFLDYPLRDRERFSGDLRRSGRPFWGWVAPAAGSLQAVRVSRGRARRARKSSLKNFDKPTSLE